jgi:hypothetical protein
MGTERDPTKAPPEFRLPLTLGVMDEGGTWPGPPTLWERFLNFFLKRRRS